MKPACLAVIFLLSGCASPVATGPVTTPSAGTTATGAPSPTPSGIPAAGDPPSPSWTLGLGHTAISSVDFSCRLPVFIDNADRPGGGAFIDFPSGVVTPDPTASAGPAIPAPGREFVGDTFYVHYYDRAFSRWVPVRRNDVSPDGSHYAYTDRALASPQNPAPRATLHVVSVKTGGDAQFDDGPGSSAFLILDFAAEGIYLTSMSTRYGLWLMDPTTGGVTQVANTWEVQGSSGNRIFWVGAVNSNDPQPINGSAPNEVDRLNLADGTQTPWFYRPGTSTHYAGQDAAGHPIIISSKVSDSQELTLGVSPGVSTAMWTFGNGVPAIGGSIADKHGVWFGSPDGIFLYSDASGMLKVSNQPGYPGNGCF